MFRTFRALLFLFFTASLFSQSTGATAFEELPRGFHDFLFGDNLEQVKAKLEVDSSFSYRGDPDVSMMLTPDRSIIDTAGSGFIERGYFLFIDEKLYQISLILNRKLVDFYLMQTRFTEKHGDPQSLDPSGMIWENEEVRLSLEYPLTVKYIDLKIFSSLLEEKDLQKSNEAKMREKFLEGF